MRGKLIVVEGTDGAGKRTLCESLKLWLRSQGRTAYIFDFPQYHTKPGELIRQYLQGRMAGLHSKLIAEMYALDRAAAKESILAALEQYDYVICNRYTASSMAYRCAEIEDLAGQDAMREWIYELEYYDLGLPVPDLCFILHMPVEQAQRLIAARGGPTDIHETNLAFLYRVEVQYMQLALSGGPYRLIACVDRITDRVRSPDEVAQAVRLTLVRAFPDLIADVVRV